MSSFEMRPMRAGEEESLLDLLEGAFGVRGIFQRYMDRDPLLRPEDTLLALDDHGPISCVQIFSKRIRLRGETVALGGIGSVATVDSYRRQGLASELLSRAIREMEKRGMALALLFTGLFDFYQRLGFRSVPQARRLLHRPRPPAEAALELSVRPFQQADLEAISTLYETYSAAFETCTVRDASYWQGQLGYAGTPDEDFRLLERAGRVLAYARCIELEGTRIAMEFARSEGAAPELAALLLALAPEDRPLVCSLAPDPELDQALAETGARLETAADPTLLWRVLDRPSLARLAQLPAANDEELLAALVGGSRALYWPSDRF
jgi:predicted acetyltransferase